jgi:DNA modification methylase
MTLRRSSRHTVALGVTRITPLRRRAAAELIGDVGRDIYAAHPMLVSKNRGYRVLTVEDAKRVARDEIGPWPCAAVLGFGLPEIDDRYHVWRVPLVAATEKVGEIVIDARTAAVDSSRSSSPQVVADRLELGAADGQGRTRRNRAPIARSPLTNTILCGDSADTLADLPPASVDLVFTSPPYFNARPDYTDYVAYDDYLTKIRTVLEQCHRVLAEGRFFVMNVAPVLLRRASRSEASRRIAVPFDMHRLFVESGYEFIDDIVWCKPEGAGWATGRGRRFAADRNPLQYKAVPVTEYVLVYRKQTDRLIDWNIRNHPDQDAVERSRIADGYERTNVWHIAPASSREHPAVFPRELAERVIRYYSFEGDVVLDPFAGIGTTADAAAGLDRRFVMAEMNAEYVDVMRRRLGEDAAHDIGA